MLNAGLSTEKPYISYSDENIFSEALGEQRVRSSHYQKLRIRVIHIRDNRRGQPNRSAMRGSRPGGTAFLITVSPMPGKYDFDSAVREGRSTAENLNTAIQKCDRERSSHYQKLRIRVIHIRDNRRGQPNRSAMRGSRPGGTAFLITVSPMPGKYDFDSAVREGRSTAENLNTAIQKSDNLGEQRVRSSHYQKLRIRVIHIRDNRRGQPNRSAMRGSRPGGTAFLITVSPMPGKYDFIWAQREGRSTAENFNTAIQKCDSNRFLVILGEQRVRSSHYQKLRIRVIHIRDNRRGQPNRSAMRGSRPGGTAFLITVSPMPGKYDFVSALREGRSTAENLDTAIQKCDRVRSSHYQKLRIRVIHIRDNRRGQPNRSAMRGSRPGGTAFLITVSPMPGKYDFVSAQREGRSTAENLNTAIQKCDVFLQRHLVWQLELNYT
uniref:SFRICE_007151 n=1 Tax=Spodoptera frugiperda TaxID=7108 RepID=A0A2H1V9D1_SPOFR